MKDFYHSFFFFLYQSCAPPTGREMNSLGAVSPESTPLFLIKTFLSLCNFFRKSVGGFVRNLFRWVIQTMYVLRFHRLGRKKKSSINFGLLYTSAADTVKSVWILCDTAFSLKCIFFHLHSRDNIQPGCVV